MNPRKSKALIDGASSTELTKSSSKRMALTLVWVAAEELPNQIILKRKPKLQPKLLMGSSPKLGVPFWGPHNKDDNILGSILGSPYLGKLILPYMSVSTCVLCPVDVA